MLLFIHHYVGGDERSDRYALCGEGRLGHFGHFGHFCHFGKHLQDVATRVLPKLHNPEETDEDVDH